MRHQHNETSPSVDAASLALADGLSFIARFDGEFARTAQAFSGTATLRRVW